VQAERVLRLILVGVVSVPAANQWVALADAQPYAAPAFHLSYISPPLLLAIE
jgi:hypothetical protein